MLEAKQGANDGDAKPGHGIRGSEGWDQFMVLAKNQAERYIRALPADEGPLEGERPREPLEPLAVKQRAIHDQGLITVLCQLHDELDAAVAAAYGWEGEVLKF